jgi:uncharacterized protein
MTSSIQPFYIMAKPVCGVCNLSCAYCYYTAKPRQLYPGVQRFMMDQAVLESYTRQYLAAQPVQANFGWQGGEPLLAGKEFFRQAVAFQKQYGRDGQVIANALQTNGTLLDDEWAVTLAEHKFLVGLSLDGPAEWHDSFRRDHAGNATFARAWAGLELLRKHGVEFNVLVTLNSRNAPHVGDIYRYFVNRGVGWLQFIPVLERDARGEASEFSCTARQFGQFMIEVFDLWRDRHVGVVSERLIDSVLHSVVHGQAALCCNSQRCANAYVLEFNGDLYACDHFVYRRWLIGNLTRTPLAELVASQRLAEFAQLKTALPAACRECEFLGYCNGGCPKHHVIPAGDGNGDAGEKPFDENSALPAFPAETLNPARVNYFCEGYKMLFRHALPELKLVAQYIERGQLPPPREQGRVEVAQVSAAGLNSVGPAAPPSRNALCPCGSGRKFKHCCGR